MSLGIIINNRKKLLTFKKKEKSSRKEVFLFLERLVSALRNTVCL